jgi:hypothetical protein
LFADPWYEQLVAQRRSARQPIAGVPRLSPDGKGQCATRPFVLRDEAHDVRRARATQMDALDGRPRDSRTSRSVWSWLSLVSEAAV